MNQVRKLVKEKKHEDSIDDFHTKLLFAILEIGEAAQIWKKHRFDDWTDKHGDRHSPKIEIPEELIDGIFYIMDAYGLMFRDVGCENPDVVFREKLSKNFTRPVRYGRHDSKKS